MIGAIIGDVIGSIYEWENIKSIDFPLYSEKARFTDDTVLTIAIADSVLNKTEFNISVKKWGRMFPNAGYGGSFIKWLQSESFKPYNSWGNGSAMRVSPVGFAYKTIEEVLDIAKKTAEITHNHKEGIKGAQATAVSIFLAKNGASKEDIKQYIENNFDYNLSRKLDDIRPSYKFDVSCQGSVPESIIAFLESADYESSIRLAVSLGGDSDTMACISGGISQAFYKHIDIELIKYVRNKLTPEIIEVIDKFNKEFGW